MGEENIVENVEKGSQFATRHVQILLVLFNIVVVFMSRLNASIALVAMTNAATTNPDFPGIVLITSTVSGSTLLPANAFPLCFTFTYYYFYLWQEFDWQRQQKSYILSSFFWGYAIAQFPGGYLSKRFGTKTVVFVCTFVSAVFSSLTPFLVQWGGWPIYCVIRTIQGLFQGALFPAIHQHIAKWSKPAERNTIGALTYSAIDCGNVLAMLMGGLIASSPLGWPGISYISAGICFGWCLPWLIFASNTPPSFRFITKEKCQYIEASLKREEDLHKKKIPVPWLAMLTSMQFGALIIARCCETWGYSITQTQIPSYMNGVLNMNIKSNAFFSALPYIARFIMAYVYLVLDKMAVRRGWLTLPTFRKVANTMAMWLPALFMIGIGFLGEKNETLAIALMTINVALNAGVFSGCILSTTELAPNHAGIVFGIVNSLVGLIPITTPLVAGVVVTDTHDRCQWQVIFIIAASIFFFGNLIFLIFGSAEAQPWDALDYLTKENTRIEDAVNVTPKSIFKEIFVVEDYEKNVERWAVADPESNESKISEKNNRSDAEFIAKQSS